MNLNSQPEATSGGLSLDMRQEWQVAQAPVDPASGSDGRCRGLEPSRFVDVAPMASVESQNDQRAVPNIGDDAPVPDPVPPQTTQAAPLHGLSKFSRVVRAVDSIGKKCHNPAGYLGVELFQVAGEAI